MSKVENITTIKSNAQKKTSDELPSKQQKNDRAITRGAPNPNIRTSPAFQGAKFNKYGYCLKHTSVQLVKPKKDDAGRVVYQELRQSCSSCQSAKNNSKKSTSPGEGKENVGRRAHGARTSSTRSRSRPKSRERGNNGQELTEITSSRTRSRSKPRNTKPRREYDTPFDSKGRCHYHVNVQLASKKMTGGWKVLQAACPKCMDEGGDDRSVRSTSSRKSYCSGTNGEGDAHGQFDKNGCCVLHPHIQVAKKKLLGFKIVRDCPNCGGGDVGADEYSVKSGKSVRSASSRKSSRSVKSSGRGKPGKATNSGRYGSLPFDADGYCCRHPNIQLAKKKTLGGFKILHDICPECLVDNDGGGRKKLSRRKSRGAGRVSDDSGSEALSRKDSTGSSTSKKKRIRVRNLRTEDEEGNHGQYTGYVNNDHQPHGDGIMKYTDGSRYDGVWNEGSKVHGKTTKRKV